MLSLQTSFDQGIFVCYGAWRVGLLSTEANVALGVFRVINTEYREVYKLITDDLNDGGYWWFTRCSVIGGELLVETKSKECGIYDVIDRSIFPLKRDRLSINYVGCKKTYVVKPSLGWLRKDLKNVGVVK